MDKARFTIIQVFIVASLVLLVGKAAQLQLFNESYREKARSTTLERWTLYPSRGLLYDRSGKLLVHNNPVYDLEVVVNQMDPDMDTAYFCKLLDISVEDLRKKLDINWKDPRYSKNLPITIFRNIDPYRFTRLEEHLYEFPGFYSVLRNLRDYPHKSAAHMLGYISEVDQRIVDKSEGEYLPGDYIGVTGLEEKYEDDLRGRKGAAYILKDNLGRKVGSFNKGALDSAAVSGDNITLSIDLELQAYAESLMKNKQGGIVAIEPSTGEILTLVSSPFYDPNLLSIKRDRGAAFDSLASDTLQPFFNRAIMAQYPPASIFKSVVALIALQENIMQADQPIRCPGYYEFGNQVFGCREHPRPRNVSVALQWSCNTYFFRTYQEIIDRFGFNRPDLGLNLFNDYLETFGLGKPLGVDIPGEEAGNVPGPDFFNKKYPAKWFSSYILSMGIGQGEIELTTIQMANLAAIMANKGWYYPPHFIRNINGDPSEIPQIYQTRKEVPIDNTHFQPVIDGMELAVTAGTARRSYVPGLDICGKTGTSQNPFGEDHSVFFGFAPKNDPKIAVAVYVENAGSGGAFAAPISSFIMEKYLNDSISPRRKYLEQYILDTPTGNIALQQ